MTYEEALNASLPRLLGYIAALYEDFDCTCLCFPEAWGGEGGKEMSLAMTSREKCQARGTYDRCVERIAFQRVLDALEKQTPKGGIMKGDEYASELCCPSCLKPIVNVWNTAKYEPRYCHYCGQRLDWNDLS